MISFLYNLNNEEKEYQYGKNYIFEGHDESKGKKISDYDSTNLGFLDNDQNFSSSINHNLFEGEILESKEIISLQYQNSNNFAQLNNNIVDFNNDFNQPIDIGTEDNNIISENIIN